jgi:hypothetical protein
MINVGGLTGKPHGAPAKKTPSALAGLPFHLQFTRYLRLLSLRLTFVRSIHPLPKVRQVALRADQSTTRGDPNEYHRTTSSGKRYLFHPKHHGHVSPDDACWHPSITRDFEFAIFEESDRRELSDEQGNLYGIRRDEAGKFITLGTRLEQVARFWMPSAGSPWHGYPLWPLNNKELNRGTQPYRPPKVVLEKMETQGIITRPQVKRLMKGDHI